MDEWMKVTDFCETYKRSKGTIHSGVTNYRKKYGTKPSWYAVINGDAIINAGYFNYMHDLKFRCYAAATNDDGLYYKLALYLSDSEMAYVLSRKSERYTNRESWIVFLQSGLFEVPREEVRIIVDKKKTMLEEFLIIGDRIHQILVRKYGERSYDDGIEYKSVGVVYQDAA